MELSMSRRNLLTLTAAATAATALSACDKKSTAGSGASGSASAAATAQPIDAAAYDKIIQSGPVADDAVVAACPWAAKIKKAGVLKRGGTNAGELFSLLNPTTGRILGFDAAMGDLLSRYITGGSDVSKLTTLSQTTVDTRETMLQNGTVDIVVATYSITPARAQKIAFAGPYYMSGDAVQVKSSNTSIKSVTDLAGKKVCTESNSTAITSIKQKVPTATVQLFADNDSCVTAVTQGRVDAYVLDQTILLANAVSNPDVTVVGQPFTTDGYGIGLSKSDSTAKAFVNKFLSEIEAKGQWKQLWELCIGPYMKGATAPTPPKLGSVAGS